MRASAGVCKGGEGGRGERRPLTWREPPGRPKRTSADLACSSRLPDWSSSLIFSSDSSFMRMASSCSCLRRAEASEEAPPAAPSAPSERSFSMCASPSMAFSSVTREQSVSACSQAFWSSSFSAARMSILPGIKSGCVILSPNLPLLGPRAMSSTLQPPSGMMPLGLVSKKVCVREPVM